MAAIYLIRHGQASFGAANYDQLSPLGLQQPGVLGADLKARVPVVDYVELGSMLRHQQTAQGCLAAMDVPDITTTEHLGWNEYDHEQVLHRYKPEFADRAVMAAAMAQAPHPGRAVQATFAAAVARWVSGEHDSEYTESWAVFSARCVQALQQLAARMGQSKTGLVFTSGGVITAIVQHLLHIPSQQIFAMNWTIANCSVTKIIYSEQNMYLSTFNDHSAFEGPQAQFITYR